MGMVTCSIYSISLRQNLENDNSLASLTFHAPQQIGDSTIGNIAEDILFVILYIPYILRKI